MKYGMHVFFPWKWYELIFNLLPDTDQYAMMATLGDSSNLWSKSYMVKFEICECQNMYQHIPHLIWNQNIYTLTYLIQMSHLSWVIIDKNGEDHGLIEKEVNLYMG